LFKNSIITVLLLVFVHPSTEDDDQLSVLRVKHLHAVSYCD